MGSPIREFRVDQFGAPRYPELLLVARSGSESLGSKLTAALSRGYELLGHNPDQALNDLFEEVPGLDRASQRAQLDALTSARAFSLGDSMSTPRLDRATLERWHAWATQAGLLPAD
jgi:NitT/TauT family transport system substrate-binding protein/putative hydroxymethylpyrimidine transport system substrate-binding protein